VIGRYDPNPRVEIKGRYKKDGTLLVDGKAIPMQRGSNEFTLHLILRGKLTEFKITIVTSEGLIEDEKLLVSWPLFGESPPVVKKIVAPTPTPKKPKVEEVHTKPATNTFTLGLGITSVTYTETLAQTLNEWATSLKASFDHEFENSKWDMSAQAFYSALPLSSSRSDNLVFLTGSLRSGYAIIPESSIHPLSAKFSVGLHYETTFTNQSNPLKSIGFGHFVGVEIAEDSRFNVGKFDAISAGVSYGPSLGTDFVPDFTMLALTLETGWVHRLRGGHSISADVSYSLTNVTGYEATGNLYGSASLISFFLSYSL